MAKIYLGLGSNVDAERHLQLGIKALCVRFGVLEISNIYRNQAAGFDGDDFLNLVLSFDTELEPIDIHRAIEEIHDLAGRQRDESRFSARTLDIDLLLYGDQVIRTAPIHVPRNDILKYSFVLGPLAEIAPDLLHPETGQSMSDHWADFDQSSHPIVAVSVAATSQETDHRQPQ